MTEGRLWSLALLALFIVLFWYFLRAPRKLQTLGQASNRAEVVVGDRHYRAIPKVDQAEEPGSPAAESELAANRVARTEPPDK